MVYQLSVLYSVAEDVCVFSDSLVSSSDNYRHLVNPKRRIYIKSFFEKDKNVSNIKIIPVVIGQRVAFDSVWSDQMYDFFVIFFVRLYFI